MKKCDFAPKVEKLIDPISVGTIHFMESFNRLLPKRIQKKLINSSAKKMPYMGFVVEPYSYFLCYEIIDLKWARELLPDGFKLIKSKVFENDIPKYYCILGCFNAHTSAFWGTRIEFYIIAEDEKTGLLTWLIIDYDTNTISYDINKGLSEPNVKNSVLTTDCKGNLIIEIIRDDRSRELILESNVKSGSFQKLAERLWIEGNLSIGYGRKLSENSKDIFSLKFNPEEFEEALQIPISKAKIKSNTWYKGLYKEEPSQIVCFPYAQHYLSDSPGFSSKIINKVELKEAIEKLDFSKIKVYSTESFKKLFLIGPIISLIITIILVVLLFI